jgi:hypothetical protein
VEAYAEVQLAARAAEGAALGILASVIAALEGGLVRDCLVHARNHLEEVQGLRDRQAVLALSAVERACASCRGAGLFKSLGAVVRAATDVLIWRVQLRATFGCRDSFLAELQRAYAQQLLDDTTKSRLLRSHFKAVASRFPGAFLSQIKVEALRKGGGRKAKKRLTVQTGTLSASAWLDGHSVARLIAFPAHLEG